MIDASGKYPTGVFQATSTDLGAYDECIETVERDELGREKMRGQYCNLHIAVGKDLSLLTEMIPALRMSHERLPKFLEYVLDRRLPGIRLGICTMEDCNQTEIESLIKAVAGNSVEVTVKNCVTNRRTQIQKTQAFILAFLFVICICVVMSTAIDIYLANRLKPGLKRSGMMECLTAFSLPGNTRIIFSVSESKKSDGYALRFIHGLKFFSIVWIVLGHSYGSITDVFSRMVNNLHYFERWETLIVTAGYLGVDTFFFLSGFLLSYTILKQRKNRAIVFGIAIARRFIRATVPLFFVIMCMYLLPLIARGPDSGTFYDKFYHEVENHWWDILLQVRNLRKEITFSALPQIWYLSTDFQLFLVSLTVIQLFRK